MKLTLKNLRIYRQSKTCPVYKTIKPDIQYSALEISQRTGIQINEALRRLNAYCSIGIVERVKKTPAIYQWSRTGTEAAYSALERLTTESDRHLADIEFFDRMIFISSALKSRFRSSIYNLCDGKSSITAIALKLKKSNQATQFAISEMAKNGMVEKNDAGFYQKIERWATAFKQ